jgi:hypothetical protein
VTAACRNCGSEPREWEDLYDGLCVGCSDTPPRRAEETILEDGPNTCQQYADTHRLDCDDPVVRDDLCAFHHAVETLEAFGHGYALLRSADNVYLCPRCRGDGEVLGCFDDICHAKGYCIHNGNDLCPTCKGRELVPERLYEEYWDYRGSRREVRA